MPASALIQQAAIELTVATSPPVNIQQAAIEVTVLTGVNPPPVGHYARFFMGAVAVEPLRIQLRGVKRFLSPRRPITCAKLDETPAPLCEEIKRMRKRTEGK